MANLSFVESDNDEDATQNDSDCDAEGLLHVLGGSEDHEVGPDSDSPNDELLVTLAPSYKKWYSLWYSELFRSFFNNCLAVHWRLEVVD